MIGIIQGDIGSVDYSSYTVSDTGSRPFPVLVGAGTDDMIDRSSHPGSLARSRLLDQADKNSLNPKP